jgi:lysophospholipase L1-like esterase
MSVVVRSVRLLIVTLLAIGAGALVYLAAQPKTPPAYQAATFRVTANNQAPTQPSSLWIGDSYTAGTGAADPQHAESCLTSAAMGWVCNLDAEGGTGFVDNGHVNSKTFEPVGKRLPNDKASFLADVVILDVGRDDTFYPEAQVNAAMDKEFAGIHADWPKAKLVVIAPFLMTSSGPDDPALTAQLHADAVKYHAIWIDPITEGWISAAKTGSMTISDKVHPDPAGHRYIAGHLAADFKRDGLSHLKVTDVPS